MLSHQPTDAASVEKLMPAKMEPRTASIKPSEEHNLKDTSVKLFFEILLSLRISGANSGFKRYTENVKNVEENKCQPRYDRPDKQFANRTPMMSPRRTKMILEE